LTSPQGRLLNKITTDIETAERANPGEPGDAKPPVLEVQERGVVEVVDVEPTLSEVGFLL